MNRRTKILAIGFGAVIAYLLVAQVVYPNWIRPLLTIDQRVAERRADLEKLEKLQKSVDDARLEYRDYVARIGSFDPGRVETAIRDRLNALIEKHKLENANTAPSRPVEDRKTGLTTSVITVTAVGSLESAVSFLKDVSELPELVRVGNPAIYPAGSGRKGEEKDLVNVRLPIEVLVLPKHKVAGLIDPTTLQKSESFVRHTGRDYSEIWNRKPFTPYVELPPLRVDTQKTINVEVGAQAFLQATPSGGDGKYTIAWTPTDGVSEPTMARSAVDTSAVRTQTYTVTVTDTVKDRTPVTATVAVSIREKSIPPKPSDPTPPPPPPPPVVTTWPDAKLMQIVMTLLRSAGTSRTNELMVFNSRTKETTYHKVTEDFDGGKLVFVHQTGGVVSRKGQYFVYPLGAMLSEAVEYKLAENYPELKAAAERAVAMETAQAEAQRRQPPIGEQPAEAQPTLDSRGGEGAVPNTMNPPLETAAGGLGPLFPVPGSVTEGTELIGPPDQAPQTPTTQNPPAQPGAKTQDPSKTPRPGSTRPRPTKGKNPGRL
jgi:hypothetical protein